VAAESHRRGSVRWQRCDNGGLGVGWLGRRASLDLGVACHHARRSGGGPDEVVHGGSPTSADGGVEWQRPGHWKRRRTG
jgi:hypothetical protein